jgi:hypothetical protein
MDNLEKTSNENIQQQLLWLSQIGFLNPSVRQQQMLDAFAEKYQKKELPQEVYEELLKDAKLLILFS